MEKAIMKKKKNKKTKKKFVPGRDIGTPELQLKRALLVGPGDPSFSESAIGVLFARGLINEYQLKAGQQYSNLRRKIFGSVHPNTADLIGSSRGLGLIDEETEIRVRSRYDHAKNSLLDCGSIIQVAVDKICIYDIMPLALINSPSLHRKQLHNLKKGMNALCSALGI
jgi:hypothetical protein|tara:strand:- start:51 stop:554 length:504 start_codon:yes stop_codon:yes gene_type:complete